MIASLSDSTLKNYDIALKKWSLFCKKNNVNLFDPKVEEILTFLTGLYQQGLSHSSINATRSAVSLIVSYEFAQDSRVKRFFKGISKLRPPRPKYDSTWDPKIVLDYYLKNSNNENLTLKDLSKKLITLLALVTGHRMQTFSLININNIKHLDSKLEIKIPDRIKTSKLNTVQPLLIIPFYQDEKICVASTLLYYIHVTKNLRNNIVKLFITTKKPVKAVSSQTLSHWVKESLTEAGVDTTIFSAHSTRHASTSAARKNGVDLDSIRKAAGWTKNSQTFARFYNREIISDKQSFALSILRQ